MPLWGIFRVQMLHKLRSWYFNIYKKCLVTPLKWQVISNATFLSAQQISANSPTFCVQLVTVYLVANGTAAVFPMKRKDIVTLGCQDPKFMLPQGFRSREGLVSKAIQGVFGQASAVGRLEVPRSICSCLGETAWGTVCTKKKKHKLILLFLCSCSTKLVHNWVN